MKLLCVLTLFYVLISVNIHAQTMQEAVGDMYRQRAQQEEQRVQQEERKRLAQEQRQKEIESQIAAARAARESSLQQVWEQALGPGTARFDRKRTAQALQGFVDLDTVLDREKFSQGPASVDVSLRGVPERGVVRARSANFKYFPQSMYVAFSQDAPFKNVENEAPLYIGQLRDDFPGYSLDNKQPMLLKGIDVMKIHPGPLLLVKKSPKSCVLVDAKYKAYDSVSCEGHSPYAPTAEKRKQALKELGFSAKTITKYGVNNPWNLMTFVACDNFDGHELVEKVAMAWRYSTVANKQGEKPYHRKQYRYVFVQKDGKEREETPKEADELPRCIDLNKKSRNFIYKSDTQAMPPVYGKVEGIEEYTEVTNGCGGRVYRDQRYRTAEHYPMPESLLKPEEQWFF